MLWRSSSHGILSRRCRIAEKHGAGFEEAATAFGDPLSLTVADPRHSEDESPFVLIGASYQWRVVVVVHAEREDGTKLIVPGRRARRNGGNMSSKDKRAGDEMLQEYDFDGGVRGKYADQFAEGSNVVVLDPDVAKLFKDSAEVNAALRKLSKQQAS